MSFTTIPDLEKWIADQLGIPVKHLGEGTVRYFVETEKLTPEQIVEQLRGNRRAFCDECAKHEGHDPECSKRDYHGV